MSTNIVLTNNNYNDYLGSDFNAKVESTVFESHTGNTTVHHTLTELDGLYVDIDGDTMTGDLTLNTANIDLDNTTFTNQKGVITKNNVPFIHNFNYGNNGTVTTEGNNIFIGEKSGNLTMGATATASNQSSNNVGIGYTAMSANTTGENNVGIGSYVLKFNTTGHSNTAIGKGSMNLNTTGFGNIAVGVNALYTNTTGYFNVAVGNNALKSNVDGVYNIAVGYDALKLNTTGVWNVSIGRGSLLNNTTGNYNVSIGSESLNSLISGVTNTSVGYYALRHLIDGTNNTAIGHAAGRFYGTGTSLFTNGTENTFLGFNTRASANGVTNETVIGYNAVGSGSNTTTIGNTSQTLCKINGAVQVGQSSATASAALVGAIRYRVSGKNSYAEMCMQTGASTYAWVVIKTNTW